MNEEKPVKAHGDSFYGPISIKQAKVVWLLSLCLFVVACMHACMQGEK